MPLRPLRKTSAHLSQFQKGIATPIQRISKNLKEFRHEVKNLGATPEQVGDDDDQIFSSPPIPPRSHRLRDLSHLIVQDQSPPPAKKIIQSHFSPRSSPNRFRSPSRSPLRGSPRSHSPLSSPRLRHLGHVSFGGSMESLSTQSGSYHMPSSAYTPSNFESNPTSFKIDDHDDDDLDINYGTLESVKKQSYSQDDCSRPMIFDPGGVEVGDDLKDDPTVIEALELIGQQSNLERIRLIKPKTPYNTQNKSHLRNDGESSIMTSFTEIMTSSLRAV